MSHPTDAAIAQAFRELVEQAIPEASPQIIASVMRRARELDAAKQPMTNDLRALVEKWRAEADANPNAIYSGTAMIECAYELQAALDAQAGMEFLHWAERHEWHDGAVAHFALPHGAAWTPPAGWPAKYRRIYAGPVEGGDNG